MGIRLLRNKPKEGWYIWYISIERESLPIAPTLLGPPHFKHSTTQETGKESN